MCIIFKIPISLSYNKNEYNHLMMNEIPDNTAIKMITEAYSWNYLMQEGLNS